MIIPEGTVVLGEAKKIGADVSKTSALEITRDSSVARGIGLAL